MSDNPQCPKCNSTDFAQVESVYDAAASRINWDKSDPNVKHEGGLTDEQIVRRFSPPRRKSAYSSTILVAIILGGASVYLWKRFGDDAGQLAAVVTIVIMVAFLLTRARKLSDGYYAGRARWRRLLICLNCGNVVDAAGR